MSYIGISHASLLLERDISPDCWASKHPVFIFLFSYDIPASHLRASPEIIVSLQFLFSWFSVDAFRYSHPLSYLRSKKDFRP